GLNTHRRRCDHRWNFAPENQAGGQRLLWFRTQRESLDHRRRTDQFMVRARVVFSLEKLGGTGVRWPALASRSARAWGPGPNHWVAALYQADARRKLVFELHLGQDPLDLH